MHPERDSRHAIENSVPRNNLAEITRSLRDRFRGAEPRGFIAGKTRMRNTLVQLLNVSALRAETLIDQMQNRGFLVYTGDPKRADSQRYRWRFETRPLSVS